MKAKPVVTVMECDDVARNTALAPTPFPAETNDN